MRLCVHAVPTAPANHRCHFWMRFTGRWGPIWFDHWGEACRLHHCITHRGKRKLLFLWDIKSSCMYTHTGSMQKDEGRHKNTDTYGYILLQQYSDAFKSFRQRERETPTERKEISDGYLLKAKKKKVEHMSRVEGERGTGRADDSEREVCSEGWRLVSCCRKGADRVWASLSC